MLPMIFVLSVSGRHNGFAMGVVARQSAGKPTVDSIGRTWKVKDNSKNSKEAARRKKLANPKFTGSGRAK